MINYFLDTLRQRSSASRCPLFFLLFFFSPLTSCCSLSFFFDFRSFFLISSFFFLFISIILLLNFKFQHIFSFLHSETRPYRNRAANIRSCVNFLTYCPLNHIARAISSFSCFHSNALGTVPHFRFFIYNLLLLQSIHLLSVKTEVMGHIFSFFILKLVHIRNRTVQRFIQYKLRTSFQKRPCVNFLTYWTMPRNHIAFFSHYFKFSCFHSQNFFMHWAPYHIFVFHL